MKSHTLLWVGIPVFNCLAQVFLKLAAENGGNLSGTGLNWVIEAMFAPWMLAAVAVEIACFFLWIKVLAEFDLSRAFPISAISYILIIAVSWFGFGEPGSLIQYVGSILILCGIWLITIADPDNELQQNTIIHQTPKMKA